MHNSTSVASVGNDSKQCRNINGKAAAGAKPNVCGMRLNCNSNNFSCAQNCGLSGACAAQCTAASAACKNGCNRLKKLLYFLDYSFRPMAARTSSLRSE